MNEFDFDKTAIGSVDAGATQAIQSPGAENTMMAVTVQCPVCKTSSPPTEAYCIDCGFLLNSQAVALADLPQPQFFGKLTASDGSQEFNLKIGDNLVGRENTDLLILHNTVSRKHAKIVLSDARAYVEDLGSSNGTYVNSSKLASGAQVDLSDGAELEFGSFRLKYTAPKKKAEDKPIESDDEPKEEKVDSITEQQAEQVDTVEPEVTDPVDIDKYVLTSKDGSQSFILKEGVNTMGRRLGMNDIVVSDSYCSGRHADLEVKNDTFTLTDIGSTNGTLVNGVKLEPNQPREIKFDDEIAIGQMVFTIKEI